MSNFSSMRDSKSAFLSRGVWGGGIVLLLGVAQIAGYAVQPEDVTEAKELVEGLVVSGAGLLALVGRIRARQRVSFLG